MATNEPKRFFTVDGAIHEGAIMGIRAGASSGIEGIRIW